MIGMPAYRLGNCILVPRARALIELATTGRVVRLAEANVPKASQTNAA